MQEAHKVGERISNSGLETVREELKAVGPREGKDVGLFELRIRDPYLKAQQAVYEARDKLWGTATKVNMGSLLEQVLSLYADEQDFKRAMNDIFVAYVDYFREKYGYRELRMKAASATYILDEYAPGECFFARYQF